MVRFSIFAALFAAFGVPAGAVPLMPSVETNGGTGSVGVSAPPGLDMRIDIIGSDNGTSGLDAVWDGPIETLVSFYYDGLTAFDLTFTWDYLAGWNDSPAWDPFGYVVESEYWDLTDSFGHWQQSGTFGFTVSPQSTFGFYIYSVDHANGAGEVRIEIARGVIPVPSPVPLPASAALMLPALGALGLLRRKARRKRQDAPHGEVRQAGGPS